MGNFDTFNGKLHIFLFLADFKTEMYVEFLRDSKKRKLSLSKQIAYFIYFD